MPTAIPTIGYTEARAKWSEITKRVIEGNTAVTVIKNNKLAFVMVPVEEYIEMRGPSEPKSLLDICRRGVRRVRGRSREARMTVSTKEAVAVHDWQIERYDEMPGLRGKGAHNAAL